MSFEFGVPSGGTVSVTGYSGTVPASLTIPATYTDNDVTYTVTAVSDRAFQNKTSIRSVTFPASLTSIGGFAFNGCTGLTSLTFPESLESIGNAAFANCTSLTGALTFPASLTSIGTITFGNCTSLATLTFLGYKPDFGTDAFINTLVSTTTASITAPASQGWSNPLVIGSDSYPVNIVGLTFTNDGTNATVTGYSGDIPANLTIPATYTYGSDSYPVIAIGANAFENQTGITSVTFPASLTSIEFGAFAACTGLTGALTFPANLTSIGDFAFENCTGLTGALTFPASLTSIGVEAFNFCSGLTAITFPVNSTLTSIGRTAFDHCTGLTSLTFPASLTSIGIAAFRLCTGLTSLTFPVNSTLTSIGDQAFYDCTGVTSLTFPESLESIGDSAFNGCTGLETLTFLGSKPTFGTDVFIGTPASFSVFTAPTNTGWTNPLVIDSTPSGSRSYPVIFSNFAVVINSDGTATILGPTISQFPSGLSIPETYTDGRGTFAITAIADSAYSGYTGITSVTFPSTIVSIGNAAFYGAALDKITFKGASLPVFGQNVFAGARTNIFTCAGARGMPKFIDLR